MIFSLRHIVVSLLEIVQATDRTDVVSDQFETLPENCPQREVKNRKHE